MIKRSEILDFIHSDTKKVLEAQNPWISVLGVDEKVV